MFGTLLQKVQEGLASDTSYKTEIEIDLSVMDKESEVEDKMMSVEFYIREIWRPWGMASLDMLFKDPIKISYKVEGENVYRNLEVDLNEVDTEYISGEGFTPEKLDIFLGRDGKTVENATLYVSRFLES